MVRSIAAFVCAVMLLAGPGLPPGALAAEEGARVILVLDASGSMWGQIEGRPKIEIARETIAKVLGTWRPQDELGLVVYGHRSKGDCKDIETVIPPGPLDRDAFLKIVNGFNPVGKTPMTDAVRQAAQDLKSSEQPATVILVSDGEETCGRDPCAVARELEQAGVGLTVHTVGFDIADGKTRDQLACMAQETGGISLTAANAQELEVALAQTVSASQAPPREPAPRPVAAPANNLTAVARLAEGGPEIDVSARWQILAVTADGRPGDTLKTLYPVALSVRLEPGDYFVRVTIDEAMAEQRVSVPADGSVAADLVLNAGYALVEVRNAADGPLLDDARIQIRQGQTVLTTGYGGDLRRLVPAGSYTITARVQEAQAEQPLDVPAGGEATAMLVLGSGTVAFTIRREAGGAIEKGPRVQVVDAAGKVIETIYDGEGSQVLPPGAYVLRAKIGEALAETPFEIKPGETTNVDLVVASGRLVVTVLFAPGGPEVKGPRIDILPAEKPLDGRDEVIETSYDNGQGFDLPPGRYRVRGRQGQATAEVEAEVAPNAASGAEVVLNAGVLAVTVPADTRLDVLSSEADIYGKRAVLETQYAGEHALVLPAGSYLLKTSRDGESLNEIAVEITAGQRTEAKL